MSLRLDDADTGEPVAVCTTNIPQIELGEDELIIKNHSENEGMLEFLTSNGIVVDTGKRIENGFVSMPIVTLIAQEKDLV